MTESALRDRVCAWLARQPRTYYLKVRGNAMQRAGVPDLLICRGGKALFVELKALGKKPDPRQEVEMRRIRASDTPAVVCRSLDEVKTAMRSAFGLEAAR